MLTASHTQVFKLAQFEGPLDLLLHLIHKAKIDLQDIFVSEITEQYLQYMEEIEEVDMDRASDFLNMAATLLYIKSRSLLPAEKHDDEDEEYIDPETELINRLRAYQKYKEAGGLLGDMEKNARNVFFKLPEELFDGEQEFFLEDVDAEGLYRAFLSLLRKKKEREDPQNERVEIRGDSFSIRKQKGKILFFLKNKKKISFFRLFAEDTTQMEMAVTFIALIELWHEGSVSIKQKSDFEDIAIRYIPGEDDVE